MTITICLQYFEKDTIILSQYYRHTIFSLLVIQKPMELPRPHPWGVNSLPIQCNSMTMKKSQSCFSLNKKPIMHNFGTNPMTILYQFYTNLLQIQCQSSANPSPIWCQPCVNQFIANHMSIQCHLCANLSPSHYQCSTADQLQANFNEMLIWCQ